MSFALCSIAMIPLRREPRHASEMVSQLLFGEMFDVVETQGHWHRVRCDHDNYEGWLFSRELRALDEEFILKYKAEQPVYAGINPSLNRIPFGARLPLYNEAVIRLGEEALTAEMAVFEKDPLTGGEAILETANRYLDTPYLWGGRSMAGIDCSGLTQMVFKLHDIALPRDAYQQAEAGQEIASLAEAKAGDLAFFAESEKISHVGILTGDGHIIHASECVRIDRIDEKGIFNRALNDYTLKVKGLRRI